MLRLKNILFWVTGFTLGSSSSSLDFDSVIESVDVEGYFMMLSKTPLTFIDTSVYSFILTMFRALRRLTFTFTHCSGRRNIGSDIRATWLLKASLTSIVGRSPDLNTGLEIYSIIRE